VRTLEVPRLSAAEALMIDASWAAKAIRRSSSSADHGLTMRRIKMAEDHGADRKHGSTNPNNDRGFPLGDVVRRFHDKLNRTAVNMFLPGSLTHEESKVHRQSKFDT
jgi:hypothetical protein